MSGSSSRTALAAQAENHASNQASQLDRVGITGLQSIMQALEGRFGSNWGALPGEVAQGYDDVRKDTNESFRQATRSSAESAAYLAKTSGSPISGGEISAIQRQDALGLDQQRRLTLGQIKLDEANAGMTANNGFMRLMTGAGQSALGLANTYQNQALQGVAGMTDTNPWGSAMAGAAAGASAGSVVPGWGTVIGGVVGGVGGYLAGR